MVLGSTLFSKLENKQTTQLHIISSYSLQILPFLEILFFNLCTHLSFHPQKRLTHPFQHSLNLKSLLFGRFNGHESLLYSTGCKIYLHVCLPSQTAPHSQYLSETTDPKRGMVTTWHFSILYVSLPHKRHLNVGGSLVTKKWILRDHACYGF